MPLIMPIKDLRNTTKISNIAHKTQEPIFITKNGYSDLVVMSSELYDKFARMNRIDQAIFESEHETWLQNKITPCNRQGTTYQWGSSFYISGQCTTFIKQKNHHLREDDSLK